MGRSVNLVSNDNGVGLRTDMELLEGMFSGLGWEVRRVHWQDGSMPVCDVAVFLELVNERLFRYAEHTVGVLNLEWAIPEWMPLLPGFDQLWAKSLDAQEEFGRLGLTNAHYTGFLSRELYRPEVVRELRCLHLRGKSALKCTEETIEAWRRYPDLPPLTIISEDRPEVPPYVEVLPLKYGEELAETMNACAIHVCASRAEGWGHYVSEAMSTGNMVVTTDASPMNEHVTPSLGFMVPGSGQRSLRAGVQWSVDPDDIAGAVFQAAAAFPHDIERFSLSRRIRIAARNESFRRRVDALLKQMTEEQ